MDKNRITDAEILEIVKPLTQKAAIVRWFRNNGFVVKPNGMPMIARSHDEAVMEIHPTPCASEDHGPSSGPDVGALMQHLRKGVVKDVKAS